ncbi:hypothetical protein B6U82_01685 [Candidatus Pacearchaeota archaeon ex4484_31]|nr:MAG: hypothetical protein B6U82_01685 [Candidatus Pacearchaeota archaeon ex4484_31]
MNKKYLMLGITIIVVALVILFSCNIKQRVSITTDTATLYVTVIDKTSKKPVENAIVYLALGHWRCHTNNEGKCIIKDFPRGDYELGVFKKGYNRFTSSVHFEKGKNYFTVVLEKKPEIPRSFSIEGIVIEVAGAIGTKSEFHYYKIRDKDGNEEYIFDEIGLNNFGKFVGKKVRITGFREKGFIGWDFKEVEGIYVEEIEVIE